MLNEEIPVNKYQKKINHMSKLENNFHSIQVLKLWVRLLSIFRFNVNSEFTFDEQWIMKKTSQDSTLDFF